MASGGSPQEFYYASDAEVAAAKERAAHRASMKAEYARLSSNPARMAEHATYFNSHHGGHVFDPGMQRFMSMKVSRGDYLKWTPRNAWSFLCGTVIPVMIIYKILKNSRREKEEMYGTGKVPYKERLWKTMS